MDTISEERIDKRLVKHDKNMVVKKKCLNFDKIPAVFSVYDICRLQTADCRLHEAARLLIE